MIMNFVLKIVVLKALWEYTLDEYGTPISCDDIPPYNFVLPKKKRL